MLTLLLVSNLSKSLISQELLDISLSSMIYIIFFVQSLAPFMIFFKKVKILAVEKCCKDKKIEKTPVDPMSEQRLQRFSYPSKRIYAWSKESK